MQVDPKTAQVMNGLKSKLSEILGEFDNSARIIYVDYPVHLNIGDLLINQGTELFFRENRLNIWRRYNLGYTNDFPETIKGIDDSVVFILHGGGNFGDIYGNHNSRRERLIARFPRNRFVVMPQTIFFQDKERERQSVLTIAQHGNCKVLCRDEYSVDVMHRNGIASASAMPDMAHMLWNVVRPSAEPTENKPFYLVRREEETAGSFNSELFPGDALTVDWEQIIRPKHLRCANAAIRYMDLLSRKNVPVQKTALWYPIRDLIVLDGIRAVSKHPSVVTDRLHAMLLALLLGRNVTAVDNSYGKLSGYVDIWLRNVPMLNFVYTKA